jgi:hypothetical protein
MAVVDIAFRIIRRRRLGGERALMMAVEVVEVVEKVEYIVPVHIIPATLEAEGPATRQDTARGRDIVVHRSESNMIPFLSVSYHLDHEVFPFVSEKCRLDWVYEYRSDYIVCSG